ncbi:MAG: S8 family serine peptidase [Gammaproteobacteria bacterium]|nr:S8 family serine peptidase [Gammaproteobacteria bacterium]
MPSLRTRCLSSRRFMSVVAVGLLICAAPMSASSKGRASLALMPDQPNGVASDKWLVRLIEGADIGAVALATGAEKVIPLFASKDTYVLEYRDGQKISLTVSASLHAVAEVAWFDQQVAVQRDSRFIPGEWVPSNNQWYLKNSGQSAGTVGEDINVETAWDSATGSGIVIGIVDDGVESTHPDLAANYDASLSNNFNSPAAGLNLHGTAVAGLAAAVADNGVCGVGVAFDSQIADLQLTAAPATESDVVAALSYQLADIDIYNNSWGPSDNGEVQDTGLGMAVVVADALQLAAVGIDGAGTDAGRAGLGSIYVWAAGNGRVRNDNVNYDNYANSRYTIAVGAVDHDGVQTAYSEPGAALFISAPASAGSVGISTTDLVGSAGANTGGDCRDDFNFESNGALPLPRQENGGTSSAAPLVSGVIALMLQADVDAHTDATLSWRDVQHILAKTATKNDPLDADWVQNGAGLWVNHKYGFGRIDAQAAVTLASTWTAVAASVNSPQGTSKGLIDVNTPIPDNNTAGVSHTITIVDDIEVEHVEVTLKVSHSYRGDLRIVLTSPAGTESVLAELRDEDANADYDLWRFMSVRHWGESSLGEWTLHITDQAPGDSGQFEQWQLAIHGVLINSAPIAPDTAFSVNEDEALVDTLLAQGLGGNTDLIFAIVDQGHDGTVVISDEKSGAFTYTPDTDFNGEDAFTFTVTIAGVAKPLTSEPGRVTVTVNPTNDVPIAKDITRTLTEVSSSLTFSLDGFDVDGDELTYIIVDLPDPTKGSVVQANSGLTSPSVTYNSSSREEDTFTYKVNDGTLDSNIATVTIEPGTATNVLGGSGSATGSVGGRTNGTGALNPGSILLLIAVLLGGWMRGRNLLAVRRYQ